MKNRNKLHTALVTIFRKFTQDESGATAVEYAMIAAATALAIAPFMPRFNQAFRSEYGTIANHLGG